MTDRHLLVGAVTVALALASCGGPGSESEPAPGTATGPEAAVAPGDPVPDREVDAFDGKRVTLADYAGSPLVVNFWASWCPPCIAEMPDLEAVHQSLSGEVSFVGVNTQDTPDAAEGLAEDTGVTYDLVRDPDGALFRDFGVFGMPSTFYVDADGVVVGRHTGFLTRDAMVAEIEEHLGVRAAIEP